MPVTGRTTILAFCIAWAALMLSGSMAAAEGLRREHHSWGRFAPGAWQTTRVTSETFDDRGAVIRTTVTDTTTTLLAASPDHYTVKVESTVEVLGKRIEAPPQIVKRTYDDMPFDTSTATRIADQVDVSVDNQQFPCAVLETVAQTAVQTVTSRTYYCRETRPFSLRRDVTVVQPGMATPKSETSTFVVAMDMPHKVLGQTYAASHIKTVHKQHGNTMVSVSVHVYDLPGGLVSQSSKELDSTGRMIRRSTQELVDYGANAPSEVKVEAEGTLRMGQAFPDLDWQLVDEPLVETRLRSWGSARAGNWCVVRRRWGR